MSNVVSSIHESLSRRRRGRPRRDEALQQQVGQFIQGIRAEMDEARDGDNAAAGGGDVPDEVTSVEMISGKPAYTSTGPALPTKLGDRPALATTSGS